MRKVIEAEAIATLVKQAATQLADHVIEHVNDHAAVPSLTKAEVRTLIREEGWSAEDVGLDEIDWHRVDFEEAAYEVGSDLLLDAAMAAGGTAHVVKYALDAMDCVERTKALAALVQPDESAITAEALIDKLGVEQAVSGVLANNAVTSALIARTIAGFGGVWQRDILAYWKQTTKLPDLFAKPERAPDELTQLRNEIREEVRAEVEREVREALIAKLFGKEVA